MFVNSDVSYSWFYNCTEVKNLLILVKKKSYDLVKTRQTRVALRSRRTKVYLTICRFCRKLQDV